ncbi:MAG: hypothetical protein ACYDIB_03570 [Desulfobulbia bacterium]
MVRLCRGKCIDDGVLDFAVLAIDIFSAPGFGKRMDAVEYLAAPVIFDLAQFFSEQCKSFLVCGNYLPWVALHQKNRGVDCFEQPGVTGGGRHSGGTSGTYFVRDTSAPGWIVRGNFLSAYFAG